MKVKTLKIFRDKFTKELYSAGKELEFDDEARIEDIVSRGLVEVIEDKEMAESKTGNDPVLISLFGMDFEKKAVIEALKTIGGKAAWNMKDETIIANVAAMDENKARDLLDALTAE